MDSQRAQPGLPGQQRQRVQLSGQSVAGSEGFTAGGLNYPIAVAIDTDASAWVVDYGNSHLTHLSSSGQALSGTAAYTSALLAFPDAVAIDGSHNVWVANQSRAGGVTKVAPDGSQVHQLPLLRRPAGLAIDRLGNVWVANYYGNSVSEISSAGAICRQRRPIPAGASTIPRESQSTAQETCGLRTTGVLPLPNWRAQAPPLPAPALPSGGLGTDANLLEAYKMAVDASGNLWISNFGSNTLTQFVGLAPPSVRR